MNDDRTKVLRSLTDAEYEGLKEDIRQHGVRVPILEDEDGGIIDGEHRSRIVEELREEGLEIDLPKQVRPGLSEDEKLYFAIHLNVARRQMMAAARRAIIRRYLDAHPEKSGRQLAEEIEQEEGVKVGRRTIDRTREKERKEEAEQQESVSEAQEEAGGLSEDGRKAVKKLQKAKNFCSAAVPPNGHERLLPAEYESLKSDAERRKRNLEFYATWFRLDPDSGEPLVEEPV